MSERFAVGGVARLFLDVIAAGAGVTGQTPTIAIQRKQDGQWFNSGTGLFAAPITNNPMVELDSGNLPGRYYFDFDHSKDLLVSSVFIAKFVNGGVPLVLSYEDLFFGPLPAVAEPKTCSIQGTIFGNDNKPKSGIAVTATLVPVLKDSFGRGFESDDPITVYTDVTGAFDLPIVQGATIRLQIQDIGYDQRVLVPALTSVLFTAL